MTLRELALFSALTFTATRGAVAAEDPTDTTKLDEITVTASKRGEQKLQDAPLSVQALSSQMLENLGADKFEDWSRNVPGLGFTDRGPGDKRYIIRGVNSTGAGTVGVYYDEAVITGGNKEDGGGRYVDLKLHDIDRIEVLKGPQGTLYGANSMSGAIRIITHQPDATKIEGNVGTDLSFTHDGGFNRSFDGVLNVPLITDKLAIRAVGWSVKNDGYIDNVQLHRDNLNTEDTQGIRVALAAFFTDNLKLTLSGTFQDMDTGAPSHYEPTAGDLKTGEFGLNPFQDRARILSAVLSWDTSIGSVTLATDKFRRHINYFQDTTRFFAILFHVPPEQCCFANGFGPSVTMQPQTRWLWDSEVRFSSKLPGPFQFVLGAFHETDKRDFDSGSLSVVPGSGEPIVPYEYFFRRHASQRVRQSAVFGEATYDFSDRLQGTVGLRYFDSSLYGDGFSIIDFPNKVPGPPKPPVTADNNKLTKKFGLSYKLTPSALLYANAAQGFRIGGVNDPGITLISNLPPGFGPDQVWMYELGTKTEWLDDSLIVNASAYTMRWSDMQNRTLDASQFVFTTNAGTAQIDGLELEVTGRPAAGLTLQLGATYADARLTQDQPKLQQTAFTGLDGDRIPNVPRFTGSFLGLYSWKIGAGLTSSFIANAVYNGSSATAFRPNDPINRNLDAYTLVNVRWGISHDNWDVSLYGDNVFDERPMVDTLVNSVGLVRIYTTRPRTFGLATSYRF
jgi:outer membrane receptor protein involved in Fe transport